MRIACVGGGPAGLYFALLMKLQDPAHEIVVLERNKRGDTFGWGVVFSDQTLAALRQADPKTATEILGAFNHWDDIDADLISNAEHLRGSAQWIRFPRVVCRNWVHHNDDYGGALEARPRYPLEVFKAMRAIWPVDRPMSVRISAHDRVEGGTTPEDGVRIAAAFKEAGADLIDVSSGQVSKEEKPVYGRMWQTPLSESIRNRVEIATIAVGAISEADHVNSIIAAGRADLCAVARPHLANPAWTLTGRWLDGARRQS